MWCIGVKTGGVGAEERGEGGALGDGTDIVVLVIACLSVCVGGLAGAGERNDDAGYVRLSDRQVI